MHFLVRNKGAVHPDRQAGAAGHIQHVAHAEQSFCAHLVQDGAAVDLGAHRKRNAGGNIGLDQARDHIHAGALGGQYEVNAGGAGFLRQAGDQLLNLLTHHHHQVGQLVDDDHDVRQALQGLRLLGRQAEGVADEFLARCGLVYFCVVARQVAHAQLAQELVAPLHFAHAPIQAVGGLLHVGHHGRQQVRNALVDRHFQHLGVDHQEAHILGLGLVKQREDHGVDADRLARARGASHQHMRHFCQVGHHRVAHDILAQAHGEHALGLVVNL